MQQETTILSPEIAVILLAAFLSTLFLPRRFALVPAILVAAFVPITQRVALLGLNLHAIRLIFFAVLLRVAFRGEYRGSGFVFSRADKTLILWVFVTFISFTLLRIGDSPGGAILNRIAVGYDIFGVYFLCRLLLNDRDTVGITLRVLSVVAASVAGFMLIEQLFGWNFFGRYSGDLRHSIVGIEIIPETSFVRDGNIRAQASFVHPILAGSVGAGLFPVFFAAWRQRIISRLGLIGLGASIFIVGSSFSSGPLLSVVAATVALGAWKVRFHMRKITWGILAALLILHFVMTAPVWALIWRASVLAGSTGYHRYALIENSIDRISEWWLLGIKSTEHWGYFQFDVTNQYLAAGFEGGILGLILFIAFLRAVFRSVGSAARFEGAPSRDQFICWAFGSALFAYAIGFIGVASFGSLYVFFYLSAAMAVSCSQICVRGGATEERGLAHLDEAGTKGHVRWIQSGPTATRLFS